MRKITVSYPVLLVISAGTLLIGIAALCSKEGGTAGIPIAILGFLILIGYGVTRRGAVSFLLTGSEVVETILGSPFEASDLISAVKAAQRRAERSGD
jgi:hypothetical protein